MCLYPYKHKEKSEVNPSTVCQITVLDGNCKQGNQSSQQRQDKCRLRHSYRQNGPDWDTFCRYFLPAQKKG